MSKSETPARAPPRRRPAPRPRQPEALPALLTIGFRPFFLAAGLWAALAMALWLAVLAGHIELPAEISPLAWHVHALLFGYVSAAVAGFLLTAIPNWTGRLPVRGLPLALLALLWLAGRLALPGAGQLGPAGTLALALAFPLAFLALVGREIVAGRNWHNLPVALALAAMTLAEGLFLAGQFWQPVLADYGLRLGLAVPLALIMLIGGRVTPSFTRNWLARRGATALPAPFGRLDRAAMAITVAALALWLYRPEGTTTGGLLALAALMLALRLARWQGHRTLAEPLVTVLHLGYAWLPVSLALLAAAALSPAVPLVAALHAGTVGAIGTMTLAMMTRASLGHAGRPLHAGAGSNAIFLAITLATASRIAAPFLDGLAEPLINLSGACWIVAFALFAILYLPVLALPKRPAA